MAAEPLLAEKFADDDLVASLLLVHGLHPHGVERRIEDALDGVRPYLGSHGGDVTLLEVVDDVVRLQFAGSCKSCPSSAVTLELTVEDAVRAAAPEIASIEVVAAEPAPSASVIPAESLLSRVHQNGHGPATWHAVPDLGRPRAGGSRRVPGRGHHRAGLPGRRRVVRLPGSMRQLPRIAGRRRAAPADGLAGRRSACCVARSAAPTSTWCTPARASTPTPIAAVHLDPIPLLVRDGVLSIAVAAEHTEAGMA